MIFIIVFNYMRYFIVVYVKCILILLTWVSLGLFGSLVGLFGEKNGIQMKINK